MPSFASAVPKSAAKAWRSSSFAGAEIRLGAARARRASPGATATGPFAAILRAWALRVRRASSAAGQDVEDEADRHRLRGVDRVAGEDHLGARMTPDAAREPLGAAEAGDDPEVHLGLAEPGLLARVDEVAGERELAAAAEREAVHRGDGRDRQRARAARGTPCARLREARAPRPGAIADISAMSAPATNAFSPAPVRTSARIAGSASSSPTSCAELLERPAFERVQRPWAG